MPPSSVNFTALDSRLLIIWRRRSGSQMVSTLQFGSNIAMQLQAFGRSQRFKTDMNLFQQAGGMEGDPVYLRLMKVEPVEIEQIDHQLQQMFR